MCLTPEIARGQTRTKQRDRTASFQVSQEARKFQKWRVEVQDPITQQREEASTYFLSYQIWKTLGADINIKDARRHKLSMFLRRNPEFSTTADLHRHGYRAAQKTT